MSSPATSTAATATATTTAERTAARGILRGRVIDAASGEPVLRFEVELHGRRGQARGEQPPGSRTFESKDGRFEWSDVTGGAWWLTVRARGYQRFELHDLRIPERGVTPEVMVPLRRGNALRGRVFDEATGVGIAGASLSFREAGVGRFEGNWRGRERFVTGKDGSFAIDGVPPGPLVLQTYAEGFASDERAVAPDGAAPLEIGLATGGLIAGRLEAADRTPVAGMIGVFNLDKGFGGAWRTNAAGEFSSPNMAPGRYQLTGESEGAASAPLEIVLAKNQRIEGLVLTIGGGGRIRGVVSGLRPAERAMVRVYHYAADGRLASAFHSDTGLDEQDSYVLTGVRPGRVTVVASVHQGRQMSKTVEVAANADATVNFDFPAGARLSGRVTRAGRPLPKVSIDAMLDAPKQVSASSETSATGDYVIEGLTPGEYRVRAGTFRSQRVRIAGDTVLHFELSDAQLAGRVLEVTGQVPVVGAEVSLWTIGKAPAQRLDQTTDHYGRFDLVGLEPGDFTLTIYKSGYEMFRDRIAFSTPIDDMTVRVRRERGVEIQVHEAEAGHPLEQVYVTERLGERTGSSFRVHLDANGTGYLPAALAGSNLMISRIGYESEEIATWNGDRLELRLKRVEP